MGNQISKYRFSQLISNNSCKNETGEETYFPCGNYFILIIFLQHGFSFLTECWKSEKKLAVSHFWENKGISGIVLFYNQTRLLEHRGGGHSLIWPRRVSAAEKGIVFRLMSLKQGIQLRVLNRRIFLPEALRECEVWRFAVYMSSHQHCIFQKNLSHDVSLKSLT